MLEKRLSEILAELEEVESRGAEIRTGAETAEAGALEEYSEELTSLEGRKADLITEKKEIESRLAEAAEVADGAGTEIPMPKKEDKRMFEVNSVEYRNAWTKHIVGREMNEEERAALTSAGAVIPTMTVNAVWDRLVKDAELLGKVDVTQFPNYVRFPRATTNNAATAQAVGGTISESSDVIGYVDLIPNEYVKLLTVGADIDHMAIDAVHDWIVDNITGQIRYAINKDVLVGTGTNSLKGIAASVSANATAIPAAVTKASILKIMATLDSNYQAGAIWIMTPKMFYEDIMGATQLNDYVINDGFQFKLFGHDVVLMSEARISGKRYKHDIKPLSDEFDPHKLLELPVKQFVYNNDHELQYQDMRGKTIPGFIAEDVEEIYPSAVIHDPETGKVESWDERRIIPGMLALIQEQQKRIDDLEARLARLEKLLDTDYK